MVEYFPHFKQYFKLGHADKVVGYKCTFFNGTPYFWMYFVILYMSPRLSYYMLIIQKTYSLKDNSNYNKSLGFVSICLLSKWLSKSWFQALNFKIK